MRRSLGGGFAALLLALTVLVTVPTPSANAAWGSFIGGSKYYTTLGVKLGVTTSGYQYNYGCGPLNVKDCDKVSSVYAWFGRTGGEVKGNKARIKVSVSFTGTGASVSAGGSASGPSGSVGITAYDKSCGLDDWYESRTGSRQVSIDTGDGKFCSASTYAFLCSVKLTAAGALRIGDQWYQQSVSDKVDIGC